MYDIEIRDAAGIWRIWGGEETLKRAQSQVLDLEGEGAVARIFEATAWNPVIPVSRLSEAQLEQLADVPVCKCDRLSTCRPCQADEELNLREYDRSDPSCWDGRRGPEPAAMSDR